MITDHAERRTGRGHAVAVWLLGVGMLPSAGVHAQALPPDTVTTVFVSDTIDGFGAVGGVATDAFGFVYVADFRNAVWRLSPEGDVVKFADGLYGASGNAIGPRGYLYQSSFNGNYVSRIERDGTVTTYARGLAGPVGIAAGPDGELYVCNCGAGTIARVDADRSVSTFASSELFACPNGITRDDRGDLYVVNFANTHVVRITPDGAATSFAQIPGAAGNGHITFAQGGFYVTKFRGHQVFRLERDGTSRPVAGTGAQGEADGAALRSAMSQPNGIAASPGGTELWVNDLVSGASVAGPARATLRRIRLVSLSDVLAATDPDGPVEAVQRAYRAFREAKPGVDTRADAIALAYRFLSGGRAPDAMAVLEMNAADHPDDANSQFQLGEGYRYTGRPDLAATQYETTLRLDPGHPQAAARLALVRVR